MENKWDLLARVVGAQLSPYWPNGRLGFPQIKWYKLIIINSIFRSVLQPQPITQTLLLIFLRVWFRDYCRTTNVAAYMLQPLFCGFAVSELLIQNRVAVG